MVGMQRGNAPLFPVVLPGRIPPQTAVPPTVRLSTLIVGGTAAETGSGRVVLLLSGIFREAAVLLSRRFRLPTYVRLWLRLLKNSAAKVGNAIME